MAKVDLTPYWDRYERAMMMGGRLVVDLDRPGCSRASAIVDYAADIREAKADLDEARAFNEQVASRQGS